MMATARPDGDPGERFTPVAEAYDRYRPSYPPELLDWILDTTGVRPPAVVADVGCGTGIATRLLAARGLDAIGVEPSPAMLARARGRGGARYVAGHSAATGLPDASVDLVTAAQCFHWFEPDSTLAELARILRGPRWCAAFWNLRDGTPFLRAYDALLREWSAEYREAVRPEDAMARLRAHPRARDHREAEFVHGAEAGRDEVIGNARSLSYVAHGVADRPGFERALNALFDAHATADRVAMRYRAVAFCFRIA